MYQLSAPHPSLRPFIEHYWHVVATPDRPFHLTVDVFVDLRADLILTFGAPYRRTRPGAAGESLAISNLDAQRLHAIRIEQHGAVVVTGARFHTGGLMPFVSGQLSEWTERVVPLEEVWGPDARSLDDDVRGAVMDNETQRQRLDAFFLARLAFEEPMQLAHRLKTAQETSGGQLRVDELADLGSTTSRTVDRLFRKHIGVGPKTFARVTRFQRALNRLKTDPGITLGGVAAECGYADQSHFVREFKRFAGVAPSRQLGYFPAGGPADFSPNVVRFVQDGAAG